MLILLKSILRNLVLPPAGPVLLACAGLLLLKRSARAGRTLIGTGLALLWLLSTPIIAEGLTRLAQRCPALDPNRIPDAQAIVVLGGGGFRSRAPEYGGGRAAELELLERLDYAAWLSRRTALPVLVTGLGEEAATMHDVLWRDFGIPVRWVDARAGDTFENARNAARLLSAEGLRRIILITSGTHMLRSVHEFEATGLSVIAAPVGNRLGHAHGLREYFPSATGLLRSYGALYELLGEPVRVVLAALHLRRQQLTATGAAPGA